MRAAKLTVLAGLLAATVAAVPSAAVAQGPAVLGTGHTSRFVPGPCPATLPHGVKAACGYLVVPENRDRPDGRTLRLAVAIVPAQSPRHQHSDPIVFLPGGPGQDAISDIAQITATGLNRDRDLVVMSQRGTLSSPPALTCPEVDRFYQQRIGLRYDAPSTGRLYVQAVSACRDRLAGEGVDLAAYNSSESAADLADLRTALGIREWNVFSHSYGTELALTYMRRYPQGIRSVTLDGVVPPSVATPGWTWSSVKESFDNMTGACAAQPACVRRYPQLAAVFTDLVSRLEAHPVTTRVTVPGVAGPVKVVLDGGALVNWMVRASHTPAEFPLAVDELAHGNPRVVAEQWASTRLPGSEGVFAHGLSLSVWCSEWVPFETAREQLTAGLRAFPTFPISVLAQAPQLAFLRQACRAWDVPAADPSIRAVTRSAIPTLAVSGSFDAQTGAVWGRYAALTLRNSFVVTLAGVAHGVFDNPCGSHVITSFYDRPDHPDTRCVASVRPVRFIIGPR
ncbi:alpha/beta fold hydrolase [Streptacidiphilus fuscans]|uniref:Alpha/beta fold hydrolase n=1 Tax=Streptacidiphilus fuscans TaxID=2789292 RepID=A0A931B256_9ACTN|nr:alpha/beta fold hydrolase [Streptacidiphilus fuscans]MBF9068994.1 alpha/beta fold hydrolase [Streptacidiphilus fuscans]